MVVIMIVLAARMEARRAIKADLVAYTNLSRTTNAVRVVGVVGVRA